VLQPGSAGGHMFGLMKGVTVREGKGFFIAAELVKLCMLAALRNS
jgi:hypothetical protein